MVSLEAPTTFIAACRDYNLNTSPMNLRLIRVEQDYGEIEVLITSLTDCEKYPYHLFAELYHDCWPVEEDYKVMKCQIELEKFSGQSELSVYQDFHGRFFSKNITSMLAFAVQNIVEEATTSRNHRYIGNVCYGY